MKISIRKASPADYNDLCELFDELDVLHRDNLPYLFQKPDGPAREKEYYSKLLADQNVSLFVAETDGKPVGFIQIVIKDAPAFPVVVPRRLAIVDSLLVCSRFQKQGIGKMLMDKGQEWAISKGATSIELNVCEFNQAAMSFYEKSGYRVYSRRMRKELNAEESDGYQPSAGKVRPI